MKRISAIFLVVLPLGGCSLLHQPGTGVDLSRPFQATYEGSMWGTKSTRHIASDGRGHVRLDCPWNGSYDSAGKPVTMSLSIGPMQMQAQGGMPGGLVEVLDVNSNEVIQWINGAGLNYFTRTHMSGHEQLDSAQAISCQMLSHFLHDAPANSKSSEALGTKTINGRSCHGWKTRQQLLQQDIRGIGEHRTVSSKTLEGDWQTEWIDDDTGILVECDVENGGTFGGGHEELTEFSAQAPDPSVFKPPKDFSEGAPAQNTIGLNGNVSIKVSGSPFGNQSMPGVQPGQSINMSMSVGKAPATDANQSGQNTSVGITNGAAQQPAPATQQPSSQAPASQQFEDTIDSKPLRQPTDVVAQPGDFLCELSGFTKAEIEKYMIRYQDTSPLDRSSLGFSLVAPKDWHSATVRVRQKDLADISNNYCQLAELDGNSPNTSLEVWFTQPPVDKTPRLREFFESFCKSVGMTILRKKEVGNRIDALVEYNLPKVGKMNARIACLQLDRTIIWMSGCAPKSDFSRVSNIFCVAATTFSPVGYNPPFYPDIVSRNITGATQEE